MDLLSPTSPVQRVVFMKGAQVGATECGNNWIGFAIHQEPGPILAIAPTVEMAKRNSKQRIGPLVEDTPVLSELVKPSRARDSGNTILSKDFRDGVLVMTGANSAVGLRSMSARYLFLDEVDGYPADIDEEGSPIDIAEARTWTYGEHKKIFVVSTPTVAGLSAIEREFSASDQRYYHVPCPHCSHFQPLKWANIAWDKGKHGNHKPKTARYICEDCGALIEERHKLSMLRQGKWIAANPASEIAGFHLSGLYSPWRKWHEIIADFLKKKGNKETLKTWTNTTLGEPFEEQGAQADASALYRRREYYEKQVPDGVLCLVGGVDVQDDRLELFVWGYGGESGEECWLIDHVQRWGDPGRLQVWSTLKNDLGKVYGNMIMGSIAVDTGGHYTQQAYKFCKGQSRIFAIKGNDGQGKPILNRPTRNNAEKVPLWTVGVDTCKELLLDRLGVLEPGPGYIHLPVAEWCDEELCAQLTAEKAIIKYTNGQPKKVWVKTRPRNEASDCWNYAYAALMRMRPNFAALRAAKEIDEQPELKATKTVQTQPKPNPHFQRRGI